MGLLFFGAIEIPKAQLSILKAAVETQCAKDPQRRYCEPKPEKSVEYLDKCFKSSRKVWRDGDLYASFSNNPAPDMDDAAGMKVPDREQCFVAALRALLVLGLHPAEHTSTTTLRKNLSWNIVTDPKFVAEMIKQSAKVVESRRHKFDIIKESTTMDLAFDSEVSRDIATRILNEMPSRDFISLYTEDERKLLKAAKDNKRTSLRPSDVKITIDVRSFESLIYFLGEVVRAEVATENPISPSALPVVTSKEWHKPLSTYIAPLFIARRGTPDRTARIAVTDDHGVQYWIPRLYDDQVPSCTSAGTSSNACRERYSFEYPAHHSMTVLTIVNELWALQKEPAERPIPTRNVGG